MKTSTAILILLAALSSVPALAQEEEAKPDYSRETLQRFVAAIPEEPKPQRRIQFYWGAVEFSALGQKFRFSPVMPFSGSGLGTTQVWPDPFSLTGTAIATPKRAWYTQRKINSELRRIEKMERAKIKVK
jgi:hypothetical protein